MHWKVFIFQIPFWCYSQIFFEIPLQGRDADIKTCSHQLDNIIYCCKIIVDITQDISDVRRHIIICFGYVVFHISYQIYTDCAHIVNVRRVVMDRRVGGYIQLVGIDGEDGQ